VGHTANQPPSGQRLVEAYYLATPLFFFGDLVLGLSIRVSALGDPGLRYLYYGFALGCGVWARARPKVAPYVGIAESSLNVLLLVLSIMLPIYQLPDRIFAGEAVTAPISGLRLANFALSGTILVASFHIHQAAILRRQAGP
jgi:hypothetical protein